MIFQNCPKWDEGTRHSQWPVIVSKLSPQTVQDHGQSDPLQLRALPIAGGLDPLVMKGKMENTAHCPIHLLLLKKIWDLPSCESEKERSLDWRKPGTEILTKEEIKIFTSQVLRPQFSLSNWLLECQQPKLCSWFCFRRIFSKESGQHRSSEYINIAHGNTPTVSPYDSEQMRYILLMRLDFPFRFIMFHS